jgi:uncharacterized protein
MRSERHAVFLRSPRPLRPTGSVCAIQDRGDGLFQVPSLSAAWPVCPGPDRTLVRIELGQTFYTDWLWFSSVGHEAYSGKSSPPASGCIWAAVLFLALAVPNLFAAVRITGRMFPRGGHKLPPQIYNTARSVLIWLSGGVVALGPCCWPPGPAGGMEYGPALSAPGAFDALDPIFNNDFSFYIFTLAGPGIFPLLAGRPDRSGSDHRGRLLLPEQHPARRGLSPSRDQSSPTWPFWGLPVRAGGRRTLASRYDLLYSSMGAVYGVGYTDNLSTSRPGRS